MTLIDSMWDVHVPLEICRGFALARIDHKNTGDMCQN